MIRNQYTGEVVPSLRSVREVLSDVVRDPGSGSVYAPHSGYFALGGVVLVDFHDPEAWNVSDFHIADNDLNAEWNGTEVHAEIVLYPNGVLCTELKDRRSFGIYLYDSGERVCIQFVVRPEWYNDVEFMIREIRYRLCLGDHYPEVSDNVDSLGHVVMEFEESLYTSARCARSLDKWAVARHAQDPDPIWREDLSELVNEFNISNI